MRAILLIALTFMSIYCFYYNLKLDKGYFIYLQIPLCVCLHLENENAAGSSFQT